MTMTDRQRRFVAEYLIDCNAAGAAVRAGYSARGARQRAHALLQTHAVRSAVEKAMKEREERTRITQDRIVEELARIAFGDPREAVTWGPDGVRLVPSGELTEEQAAGIAEVAESTRGTPKLKRHDKVKALELLGKHLGMFASKTELSGNVDLAAAIKEARKRAFGTGKNQPPDADG